MIKKLLYRYNGLNKTVKASIWFLICSFLQRGISVITTPIFTRLLNTAEYGQYNVFNSWLGIITVFVTLSMFNGVYTQGLVKFDSEKGLFSSALQGMTLLMIIVWGVIYALFYQFWNNLFSISTKQMLIMFVMIWASAVFSFWAAEQRVELNYKKLVIVTVIVSLAKPTLGIVFVLNLEDKVTARLLGIAIVEVVCYTWMFFAQLREGKSLFSWKYWKYAFIFSVPLIPHYLAQNILASSDRIMIERMIGGSEAGIYSLAYSIAQIMLLFNLALTQTISPWIMKKIKEKSINTVSGVILSTICIISAVNILLIALSPEMVRIFAPVSYYNAIWVIPPVALSVIFQYGFGVLASFEFYYEKRFFITSATLISAVLNLLLNYIFIPIFGYVAAAYTTLICYIALFACHYIFVQKIANEHLDGVKVCNLKALLSILCGTVAIGILLTFTYKVPIVRYIIIACIAIAIYVKRDYVISVSKSILEKRKPIGGK